MSDLQTASRMNEAASGMVEAAELMARAVACLGEIEDRKADLEVPERYKIGGTA